jgi:hypothetical protein
MEPQFVLNEFDHAVLLSVYLGLGYQTRDCTMCHLKGEHRFCALVQIEAARINGVMARARERIGYHDTAVIGA